MQVGVYTIEVELSGFKKAALTGNRVTIGQPTTVNVVMQVGEASETVTVTDAYELVQTSTSGNIGAIIEQQVLQDLPIVGTRGRNPLGLVNTQPGVVSGANTGGGLNLAGYTFTPIENERQYDGTIKVDHAISSRHTAFFRLSFGQQNTICDTVNGVDPRFPGLPCPVNTYRKPRNWAANWRWAPTPLITNKLVVGQNHFVFDFQIPTADATKPTFTGTSITQPDEYEFGNARTLDTLQVVDNFTYLRGAHAFKMGVNIRLQKHVDTRGSVAGQNVSPLVDFSTSVNTVDPVAFKIPSNINQSVDRPVLESNINFLLGRVGQISQAFVSAGREYAPGGTLYEFDARFSEIDFYWQDSWKLRRNLTIDLGLRLEMKLSPSNPDNRIYAPNQPVKLGYGTSNTIRWQQGKLYQNDLNNWAPSIGVAWDPFSKGKTSIRLNYRTAYDRISTFGLSSAIFQNFPGQTLGVVNTSFGGSAGRLSDLPTLTPPDGKSPVSGLQPPSLSFNNITVMDPDFRMPKTHMWSLSIQHEIWNRTILQAAYIGRRGIDLSGGYNVNQMEIYDNGFLDAFKIVKAGGESTLMNELLSSGRRLRPGETGSQMVRRLYASSLTLNSVAAVAASIQTQPAVGGQSIPERSGFGPYFFIPYPQFSGGWNVIDSNDYSAYHGMEWTLERQFSEGFAFLVGYTLAKSLDTRSYDPVFTIVSTGSGQSASSTPFNIKDRRLNYAISDFDRTHVLQARWSYELPFGVGRRWMNGGVLAKVLGGWDLSGFMTIQGGRPFTVYGGSNTMSNVVQTPADCNNCGRDLGKVRSEIATTYNGTMIFYFDPTERSQFSTPPAGQLGNTGRNYFRGPGSFNMDLGVLKRTYVTESHYVEFRAEFTNLSNTPTFGFPTTTVTSSTFGRIRDTVISGSRKIQLALKYYF